MISAGAKFRSAAIFAAAFFLCLAGAWAQTDGATNPLLKLAADRMRYPARQDPQFLTFQELLKLSTDPHPGGALEAKLEKFWTTPIIDNGAYYRGAKPHRPDHPKIGPIIRVITWNIEKTYEIERVKQMLTASDAEFQKMINTEEIKPGSPEHDTILRQRAKFWNADIVVLQEMDIGVKRSDYFNGAEEIAKTLNMNYAYGAEQLEIDPVIMGTEKILLEDGAEDTEAQEYYRADPARYKGVFGSAVLSRYPIKSVKVFQLKNQAYDWFWPEKNQTTFLEDTRRFGAKTVFLNQVTREMKAGGRIYMQVDLDVPGLPDNTLTVINIHLEIKCQPMGRETQIAEILSYVHDIKNPLIMLGDFNSAHQDLSPTSVGRTMRRAAKNPTNWLSAAIAYISPYGMAINTTRGSSNLTKNYQDPTAGSIPVIAPNKVKGLFKRIEVYSFADGHTFDFRGDKDRSINGKDEKLANSNQRDFKGFKTTFQVKRPIGPVIGKYRLDWIFVKAFLNESHDENGPYKLAPHFGETLEELNTGLTAPLSDHHPNVVDLPFDEPKNLNSKS